MSFVYAQHYVNRVMTDGELVDGNIIWTKGSDGKYRSTQTRDILEQLDVDILVQAKELRPIEAKYNIGIVP